MAAIHLIHADDSTPRQAEAEALRTAISAVASHPVLRPTVRPAHSAELLLRPGVLSVALPSADATEAPIGTAFSGRAIVRQRGDYWEALPPQVRTPMDNKSHGRAMVVAWLLTIAFLSYIVFRTVAAN